MPSALPASSPIFGCMLLTSAGRSLCASDHAAWAFLPTTGSSATLAGGAGMRSVLSFTPLISSWTESPNELPSITVGTTIRAMPRTTISVAARPCLPPIRFASIWCSG